jgi:hypothetical protein
VTDKRPTIAKCKSDLEADYTDLVAEIGVELVHSLIKAVRSGNVPLGVRAAEAATEAAFEVRARKQ